MSEAKFTKGPWIAKRRLQYYEYAFALYWQDRAKPGIHTRRLDAAGTGHFIECDARLLAAAPELYEALEELCRRLGPRWFLEQNWADPLAALAKARGES